MSENPAPDAILELVSCHCSRSCTPELCSCLLNGLRCTDMCRLEDCDNQANLDEENNDDFTQKNDSEDEDID